MKKWLKYILYIIGVAAAWYVLLPAIHPQALETYVFVFIALLFLYAIVKSDSLKKVMTKENITIDPKNKWLITLPIIALVLVINYLAFSPIFAAKSWANRITVTPSEFTEDIHEVDLNNLPLLDKTSTSKVGDRVMGQIPELISQFDVSSLYTQINYQGRLVRVTPLNYNGLFKWLNNRSSGIPGYIVVDSTTGEAKLIRLEEGITYSNSAYFQENLTRHLRFRYPFKIFGETNFEINEEGHPYWVTQVLKYKFIQMMPDIEGIIVTDAVNGDTTYYSTGEVPAWIDHVYSAALIVDQVNCWGMYQGGFLNSFIGQKDVTQTTEGYTYLAEGDDIYIYTGLTSALGDESNIGFILSNLRTKQTTYYAIPGAEEYSAMASAEGAIQEKGYISTFPLLINLNSRPTYLVSLKDAAGLVKAYAFIDVANYQKVKVTDSEMGLKYAANAYLAMMGDKQLVSDGDEVSGTITSIEAVVIDGYTHYYFMLEGDSNVYKALITTSDTLPFKKAGDPIRFTHQSNTVSSISE